MFLALLIIIAIILTKYNPVYEVSLAGEKVGYVKDINKFEESLKNEINNTEKEIASVKIENEPEYSFKLISNTDTNEGEIIETIKEDAQITYSMYAITLNGQEKAYVESLEEATEVVDNIKEELNGDLDLNLAITEVYTDNLDKLENCNMEIAKENINEEVKNEIKDQQKVKEATVNGIYLATTPLKGTITSRYGANSRIRSGAHTGLDIATKTGTGIKSCASGEVIFAGSKGPYGNLVKISHGNGVETWYAHCSKIYVKVGQKVKSGDTIAAVGSTGNSTGPHLHLEIRINGNTVNPQKYLYR